MVEMPDDLDSVPERDMILRGEAPPTQRQPQIQDLELDGTSIVDLAPLAGLDHLRSLNLHGTQVKDLRPLAGLWRLEELDLSETQVADLSPLANLPNLRCLDLPDTQVSDLAPLAALHRLEDLDLRRTRVVDLKPLAGLAELRGPDLGETRIGNLKPLADLRRLEELDLGETRVVDLTPLAALAGLQWLSLEGTRVTDLRPLAGLRRLERVDLRGTRVTDLAPVAHVKTVTTAVTGEASVPSGVDAAPPLPRPLARWTRLWRPAALTCGLAIAAIVARELAVAASYDPRNDDEKIVKLAQLVLYFGVLPFLAAGAFPWLCAARWGRQGAWRGARAMIWFFLATCALFVAFLVASGADGDFLGFAAFGMVPMWLGVVFFAVIGAQAASEDWPNGRPARPRSYEATSAEASLALQTRLAEALRRETQGEVVRWTGRPSAERVAARLRAILVFGVPLLALPVLAVAGFIIRFSLQGRLLVALSLLVLTAPAWLFLALVGHRLVMRPLRSAWDAGRTIHAVTDRRLVTIVEGRSRRIESVWPAMILSIDRKDKRDGFGNLRLSLIDPDPENDARVRLDDIPDVRKVEGMLMELKERAAHDDPGVLDQSQPSPVREVGQ